MQTSVKRTQNHVKGVQTWNENRELQNFKCKITKLSVVELQGHKETKKIPKMTIKQLENLFKHTLKITQEDQKAAGSLLKELFQSHLSERRSRTCRGDYISRLSCTSSSEKPRRRLLGRRTFWPLCSETAAPKCWEVKKPGLLHFSDLRVFWFSCSRSIIIWWFGTAGWNYSCGYSSLFYCLINNETNSIQTDVQTNGGTEKTFWEEKQAILWNSELILSNVIITLNNWVNSAITCQAQTDFLGRVH